jgi:nucleoside-diphosphate-sugar epimerase
MSLGDLAGRNVLVTGGSGFIGANLCAALAGAARA